MYQLTSTNFQPPTTTAAYTATQGDGAGSRHQQHRTQRGGGCTQGARRAARTFSAIGLRESPWAWLWPPAFSCTCVPDGPMLLWERP